MRNVKDEADFVKEQPLDKVDKNLRHIFGLLVEKDWKTAKSLVNLMKEGNEEAKELAIGFDQLVDFLKDLSAGKELKAAIKYLDSIILDDELETLLPKMDDEEYKELKDDIVSKGILAPLIVQEAPEGLLLVDGYTRYRIAEELDMKRVPVVSVPTTIDSRVLAIALNIMRRHVSKEKRIELVGKLPVPKVGRPKKGEQVISKANLAKELGVSVETIKRDRREKRGQKAENDPFSSKKKPKKILTPPDSIAPLIPTEESKTGVVWFTEQQKNMFDRAGYVKGIGYSMDFTKDQVNYDWLVTQTENCMNDLLRAIKKAGLEDVVANYRMSVSFEARKRLE